MLLVKPSMFGKLEVHASEVVWRFKPITFYIGELRVKLILARHEIIRQGYKTYFSREYELYQFASGTC